MNDADYNIRQYCAAKRLQSRGLIAIARENLQTFGCPEEIRTHEADETPLEYAERMMGSNPPKRIRLTRFLLLSPIGARWEKNRFGNFVGAVTGFPKNGTCDVMAWVWKLEIYFRRPADKFDGPVESE